MKEEERVFSYYHERNYGYLFTRKYSTGEDAIQRAGDLHIKFPVRYEEEIYPLDLKRVLKDLLHQVSDKPVNQDIIACCPPCNIRPDDLRTLARVVIEIFSVNSVLFIHPAVAALAAAGMDAGIMLHIGNGLTQVAPVFRGRILQNATLNEDYGFAKFVSYLFRLLWRRGYNFKSFTVKYKLNDIVKQHCFVSVNPEDDLNKEGNGMDVLIELPDGEISLGTERFLAPEILFDPSMIGLKSKSLPELVLASLELVDDNIKPEFRNIILWGYGVLPGLAKRLEKELNNLSSGFKLAVQEHPRMDSHPEFLGAVILAKDKEFLKNASLIKVASLLDDLA
ncbi:MAG: hypothetical protein ACTSWN_10075 [Promethearchaeota archaeon]